MEDLKTETLPEEMPIDTLEETATDERNVKRTIIIVVVAVLAFAIIVAAFYGLVSHPILTSVFRDIAIIVLALVTIVIGAFLAVLIFQLQSLTALLRDEIRPILESANETANTVRGTTTFVSGAVVSPMITAASYVTAVRQTLKMLSTNPSSRKKAKSNEVESDDP